MTIEEALKIAYGRGYNDGMQERRFGATQLEDLADELAGEP